MGFNNLLLVFCWFCLGAYIVNYLATKGPEMQPFVIASLIQLLCRLTKFGWLDDDRFRDVVKESTNFLEQVVHLCLCMVTVLSLFPSALWIAETHVNVTFLEVSDFLNKSLLNMFFHKFCLNRIPRITMLLV